jgi:hypothetical protein
MTARAQAGKDTVAQMIKMYCEEMGLNVLCLAYADYLKMIAARNFTYSDKESDRAILQEFGQKVRDIDEKFWVDTVWHTIDVLNDEYDVFIISDARHPNELQPFPYNLSYPTVNIYINRDFESPLSENEQLHESEKMATNPNFDDFHYVIDNNGTIDELYKKVVDVVSDAIAIKENLLLEQRGLEMEYINKIQKILDEVGDSDE